MQFLNDLWESDTIKAAREKGIELFEAADEAVAVKYAEVKPHIDDFVDNTAYPAYVKVADTAETVKNKVTDTVFEFLAR